MTTSPDRHWMRLWKSALSDVDLRSATAGAAMVEYVVVLVVATLVAVVAMYQVGTPMVQYFLYARALLVYPT